MEEFNIPLKKASDPLSKLFLTLIDTSGSIQFVNEPTHCRLQQNLHSILSQGIEMSDLTVSPIASVLSDHFIIKFEACPEVVQKS